MSQNIPELERIMFFDGQQLTAADLSELQRTNRELRWLHNRSLHRWGIGFGLDVTGQKGDSTVTVSPGYGVDCLGREIILTQPVTKTVPAVGSSGMDTAASFYLVAGYQADADQKVLERRNGSCHAGGAVRLSEEPLIDWRSATRVMPGNELILAQASILNCQLSQPLSLAVRRYARPAQQPYTAVGQTVAKETQWSQWKDSRGNLLGILTIVDTSAAHFKTTPRYVAHIVGERFWPATPPLLAIAVPSVVDATSMSFTMQVLLPTFATIAMPVPVNPPAIFDVGVSGKPDIVQQLGWQVVWMGIEG